MQVIDKIYVGSIIFCVVLVLLFKQCMGSEIAFHIALAQKGVKVKPMITMRGIPFDQVCRICSSEASHYHFKANETMSLCDVHEASYNKFRELIGNSERKDPYAYYATIALSHNDSQYNSQGE